MTEEKPEMDQRYTVAINSTNMSVATHPDIRTPVGDMIVAAGMNRHRLGMALARLRSEWDGVGKPTALAPAALEQLAATYSREPVGTPHAGKVAVRKDGNTEYLQPLALAKREADAWHMHELKIVLQRLKTLPEVRAALMFHARSLEIEDGEHAVGAILQWWLAPRCLTCKGGGQKVSVNNGKPTGKACGACKGSGEMKVPHGPVGRRLLDHIAECGNAAKIDLKRKLSQRGLKT